MKIAQAVLSQTPDGRWKIFFQSDQRVESQLIGSLDDVIRELRFVATKEWEQRSRY